jgi:hypothetical protein
MDVSGQRHAPAFTLIRRRGQTLALKMEVVFYSVAFVPTYMHTWRHNPEDHHERYEWRYTSIPPYVFMA